MSETIFGKIIAGEIPAHKIYEDDRVLAFLDIYPKGEGHTLVIPKKSVEFVWDMADDDYVYLMKVAKKIALHLRQVLSYPYVRMAVVGTDVPHAHVHLVPFDPALPEFTDGIRADDQKLAELAQVLSLTSIEA